ncbi:PAS domain-containing protein [Emcibacter sp.]|uniref:PAS domain-containing protein n=1 Tax=Emcibacter sp. TaxID=1979954 RepID=UPI002AA75D5A|nr:PAS domain-containing protein [Emcibacter sp.]
MANFLKDFKREDFSAEFHCDLYDYWLSKKGDRLMPSRKDINPIDMPALLPHLIMLEVHGNPPQYRVRLTGTRVDTVLGRSLRNVWAHDIPDSEGLRSRFDWLVEHKRSYYSEDRLLFAAKEHRFYSCLVCPLSSDGENVDMILSSNDYY